ASVATTSAKRGALRTISGLAAVIVSLEKLTSYSSVTSRVGEERCDDHSPPAAFNNVCNCGRIDLYWSVGSTMVNLKLTARRMRRSSGSIIELADREERREARFRLRTGIPSVKHKFRQDDTAVSAIFCPIRGGFAKYFVRF